VAYTLVFAEPVRRYLRNLPGLSRQGRLKLFVNLRLALENIPDATLRDPAQRVGPDPTGVGPSCYRGDIVLRDSDGDGRVHQFVFVVDDRNAPYGVLEVVYVEHRAGSAP
jgi:hypothetical protein